MLNEHKACKLDSRKRTSVPSTQQRLEIPNAPFPKGCKHSLVRPLNTMTPRINAAVPGADQYFPVNIPPIGTSYSKDEYPQNANLPQLFRPITLKGTTFKNRIFTSPMCQYSSDNGHATDWHFVHIGALATRGVGAITMEATSVVPEGRISPQDAGLWTDSQIAPLKRIVNFVHAHDTKIGIQLSHAGRKASTLPPWIHDRFAKIDPTAPSAARNDEDGWLGSVYGPSATAHSPTYPLPRESTEEDLLRIEDAFLQSVERAKAAGYDYIEIHGAHGYFIHEFLSPIANERTDHYGGSLENRMRFPLRLIKKVREAWDKPLFVRISATDWAEGPEQENGVWKYWGIEQSKILVGELAKIGIDLLDCSTGGVYYKQKIPVGPLYQVPFAQAVKEAYPALVVGAVGLITTPQQAESVLEDGKADLVFLGRELLRNPNFALTAALELGTVIKPANQYERAWTRLYKPKH
ncbi:NADPH dehydrogenase YqjM-like protein [Abortiporus biennis]